MTISDILQMWAKHVDYQKSPVGLALGSPQYEFHRCGETITELNEEFDPSGRFAVLYLKIRYKEIMKQAKASVFQFIENPHIMDEYVEMWKAFNSDTVKEIEASLVESFNKIISEAVGAKLIGQSDSEEDMKSLYYSIASVIECLGKCNVEKFQDSKLPIGKLDHVSSVIEIFPTLAHCLLTLENRNDGVYICYISQYGNAGGYFSIFFKSNGNILSINDRPHESYVGQHANSRNGRWTESAQEELFPYGEILKFSDRDYKGYAMKWSIRKKDPEDENSEEATEFHLKDMSRETLMSMVLAILLLMNKYVGTTADDARVCIVDSLMERNYRCIEAATECHDLIPAGGSALLKLTSEWDHGITTAVVLSGEFDSKFDYSQNKDNQIVKRHRIINFDETGHYQGVNSIFVDLFGEGFELDAQKILYSPNRLMLNGDKEVELAHKEFVGTHKKMQMEAYRQARKQLAEYIQCQMVNEYEEFGGDAAVGAWFKKLIYANKDKIIALAIDSWVKKQRGEDKKESSAITIRFTEYIPCAVSCGTTLEVQIIQEETHYGTTDKIINSPIQWYGRSADGRAQDWKCPITGTRANVWFDFHPCTWLEIERVFGVEVPKILKGWTQTGLGYNGNSILSSTDPVGNLEHPYQVTGHHGTKQHFKGIKTRNFSFAVGLSKRGLNKKMKELSSEVKADG